MKNPLLINNDIRLLQTRKDAAFTALELLIVIAVLAMLTVILLPTLARAQQTGCKTFQCLNNMRQLAQAWTLYYEDNHDRLAINSDPHVEDTSIYPSPGGGPSWITGVLDWSVAQYNTNTGYFTRDVFSLLGGYLGRSPNVFACPATATFVSPVQRSAGWTQRSRSVAMNAAVGDGYKYESPNPFGWSSWYVGKKATDFHTPGPAAVWVFADEHPDSMDDGMIYTSNYASSFFTELLGSQHEGAGTLTFADGHVEIHKWRSALARQSVQYTNRQLISCSTSDLDMLWLAQHTPQN